MHSALLIIQTCTANKACLPNGNILSFLPLPITFTYFEFTSIESMFSWDSSLSLSAELYMTSIIALSLSATIVVSEILQSMSISFIDRIFGSFLESLGVFIPDIGVALTCDVFKRYE